MQPQDGGKFHRKLNSGERPIANKQRERTMKRTLKRECKVLELVNREAHGNSREEEEISVLLSFRDGRTCTLFLLPVTMGLEHAREGLASAPFPSSTGGSGTREDVSCSGLRRVGASVVAAAVCLRVPSVPRLETSDGFAAGYVCTGRLCVVHLLASIVTKGSFPTRLETRTKESNIYASSEVANLS
eukprot:TRINITY_DN3_c0_g1_i10.p4 TRINITY_DN3_c0_g1~~TRINITY_DN3_c0_g1_i10.p4  ORF type:complete len:187 (+),score=9.81 TRINITY_DN3_c0_g1_i10:600-1160(+)